MSRPQNDLLLKAMLREPTNRTPIWIMRQAGRYLAEYNSTRKKAGTFMDLCRNPDLATEVALQPLKRFSLDAAIVFSDILTIPDAMNLGLHFVEGSGPRLKKPLRNEIDIAAVAIPDPEESLGYVMEAIRQTKQALKQKIPLIGFSGSPFTLACYMVDGAGGGGFSYTKTMLYKRPDLLHTILRKNTQAVTRYLNAQIDAGAQAIMIFDTWGGLLAHDAFKEFSLKYFSEVLGNLKREKDGEIVPTVVFTKGGGQWLELIAKCGADCVGVDWTVDINNARRLVGNQVSLQGNLDPMVLLSDPKTVARETKAVLRAYGSGGGHVFNLGHGISQFTPVENVAVLVETVLNSSASYH